MRAIRSKNTRPEMVVRRAAYALGYRYRLHRRDLPGKPDLAFIGRRKAIVVHGCFWHQHDGCREGRPPASNSGYWGPKLERNRIRDAKALCALKEAGWATLVIWECDLNAELPERLTAFLA
jgi:DNA mismatch endonuclease (patch repair protein)